MSRLAFLSASRPAFLSAWALCLVGCRQLPEIPADVCGNGVIEAPEDCDGISRNGLPCRPPGAVGQCRLDCSPRLDGTLTRCPAGSGCDEQNVCRRATGDFRPIVGGVPGNTRSVMSGDFDGDGRADVVGLETPGAYGARKTRVHYFDARGEPRATWAVGRELGQPSVANLFDDSRADLVYSTGALGILSGEPDGSLIPEAYPSYYLSSGGVRVLPVLETRIDDAIAFLILTEIDGKYGLFRTDGASETLVRVADLPAGSEALAAEPIAGDLREDDARYPCSDAALAYRGASEVLLFAACDRDPVTGQVRWRDSAEITRLTLEAPTAVDRGLLMADLDGDGLRDLLVGTRTGPHAAFGEDGVKLGPLRAFPILSSPGGSFVTMPIAAGQFAGDAAADLVLPDRLVVAVAEPGETEHRYRTLYDKLGSPWSEALVADFNNNGKPDVVAASATGIDLDFFNGAGGESVNAFTIRTSRSVRQLAAGDFDGDLINDVAFVQNGSGSAPEDQLSIAFGSASGAPTAPATAARLAGIEQIAPFLAGGDSLSSLTVISDQRNDAGDSTSALSLLIGSGDRSLPCPIEMSTFAADGSIETAASMAVTVGSFTDRSRRDLMAIGFYGDFLEDDFGMWLLPDVASRRSAPQSLGRRLDLPIRPIMELNAVPELAIRLAAGDLDRDGLDDLVIVAPDSSGMRCIVGSASVGAGASGLVLREPITFDDLCVRGTELALADVDHDGLVDVVLLLGSLSTRPKLMVLWGDGSGALRTDQLSLVSQGNEAPVAFTLLRSTPDAPLRLAYVTEHGVALAFTGSSRRFEEVRLPTELEQGTGITAADVNGDGIVDLVVADSGSVRVLRAELVD